MEKNLGHATAYGYAKSKGYSGTEEEFAQLMADYASVGQSAAQSAEQAAASATSASGSAATAASAAQTATSKASEAVTAAGTATTKASEASQSATSASQSAESAGTSAQTATTAATTATTKASEASESAATATTAKTDAETARDAAAQSASEAAASAESIDPDEFNRKIYAAFATDTATGVIASLPDGADSIPMKDVLVHIEPVQAGSGDPSPDNVRPITGWTGAKVTRTGKNLAPNFLTATKTQDGLTLEPNVDGSIRIHGTSSNADSAHILNRITLQPGELTLKAGSYTFNINSNNLYVYGQVVSFMMDGNRKTFYSRNKPSTMILDVDTPILYLDIGINFNEGNPIDITIFPQLELGSTATKYEPYSGQTYDITFPTEAGTVYGGTLDVTTGELVVDRANIASYNGESLPSTWISDRDAYAQGATPTTGAQVVYELATPITLTLTTQEIKTLLGNNNIWADAGESTVIYRADTTLYINRKIAEAVSALS